MDDEFWDRVATAMKASGYTLQSLSVKMGKKPRAIEFMKARGTEPRLSDAEAMAKLLGMSLDELATGKKVNNLATGMFTDGGPCDGIPPHKVGITELCIPMLTLQKIEAEDGVHYHTSLDCSRMFGIPDSIAAGLERKNLCAAIVGDTGMVDVKILPQDVVIIDRTLVSNNGIYVIQLGKTLVTRVLEFSAIDDTVTIAPRNENFRPITMKVSDDRFRPLGMVVIHMHKLPH